MNKSTSRLSYWTQNEQIIDGSKVISFRTPRRKALEQLKISPLTLAFNELNSELMDSIPTKDWNRARKQLIDYYHAFDKGSYPATNFRTGWICPATREIIIESGR